MIVIVSTRRLFCSTTYLKIPRAPRGIRFLLLRRHLGPLVFGLWMEVHTHAVLVA
jgi:hypothetical protein